MTSAGRQLSTCLIPVRRRQNLANPILMKLILNWRCIRMSPCDRNEVDLYIFLNWTLVVFLLKLSMLISASMLQAYLYSYCVYWAEMLLRLLIFCSNDQFYSLNAFPCWLYQLKCNKCTHSIICDIESLVKYNKCTPFLHIIRHDTFRKFPDFGKFCTPFCWFSGCFETFLSVFTHFQEMS